MANNISCWIVTEGMAGTENQCLGVADALGLAPVVKRIGLREPWRSLSPWLGFETAASFSGDTLAPPWPDLLLASGRKAIAAARYVKKASGGRTFTAFIQDPRIDPGQFDLVSVPHHDPTRGPNVIVTTAAPNRITAARLADAKNIWAPVFEAMRAPRVAVLIGGNSKAYKMPPAVMQTLADRLRGLDRDYSLMITASRRTGAENEAILRHALDGTRAWLWDGNGDNPYFGMLAWADYIIVTADSVSMLSEAATTGKPVFIAPLEGGTARFRRFHDHLLQHGFAQMFDGTLNDRQGPALDDAGLVAAEIRRRLDLKMD